MFHIYEKTFIVVIKSIHVYATQQDIRGSRRVRIVRVLSPLVLQCQGDPINCIQRVFHL